MLFPYTTELANPCQTGRKTASVHHWANCYRKDFVYTSVFSSMTCCDSPWRLVFIKLHPDKCHLCLTGIMSNECTWCITLHCTHSWMLWWWRRPDSSCHISYRNAWDSLFHLDEHIDYLNRLLKWQVTEDISQSLDNCHCQHHRRFYFSPSCSSFNVGYPNLLPPTWYWPIAHWQHVQMWNWYLQARN